MGYNAPGASYGALSGRPAGGDGPLVVVFERDDAIAVPLLSHLRMAGYDVRGARTPVELFDQLQKHPVALMLIDLGSAATGRREFWVALDAQRRGRAAQVLTYRFLSDTHTGELDFDLSARALADVEVRGPQDLQTIIDAALQRVPVGGGASPLPGAALGGAGIAPFNPFGATAAGGMGVNIPSPLGSGFGAPPFMGGGYPPPEFGMPDPAGGYPFPPLGAPLGAHLGDPNGSFAFPPALGQFAPGAGSAPIGEGYPGAIDPNASLFGQAPSAFAGPAGANPFADGSSQASQFEQPFGANPFASQGPAIGADGPPGMSAEAPWNAPDGSPFAGPAGQNPFAGGSHSPMAVAEMLPFGGPPLNGFASSPGQNGHAPQLDYGGFQMASPTAPTAASPARGDARAIADAWVPPGGDEPMAPTAGRGSGMAPAANDAPWSATERFHPLSDDTEVAFPTYDIASAQPKRGAPPPHAPLDETSPVPSQLPAMTGALTGADRALGTVLVEGALLSPRKLEVLKGIQQMLTSVEMEFKLGELALLFKFLSPDQLLAALLVSRGLVTPQQIAGLGRIKQELGGSGMDYDLETLLVMFHVLPAEELRELRKELM